MNEAVYVGMLGCIGSMGAILVVAAAAGLLLTWLETRAEHGQH